MTDRPQSRIHRFIDCIVSFLAMIVVVLATQLTVVWSCQKDGYFDFGMLRFDCTLRQSAAPPDPEPEKKPPKGKK